MRCNFWSRAVLFIIFNYRFVIFSFRLAFNTAHPLLGYDMSKSKQKRKGSNNAMDKEGLRKQGYDEEENDSDESTVTVTSGMDSVSLR